MNSSPKNSASAGISEDWLAVIIAFALIALAAVGVIGPAGLPIVF
jgi:hypothetical protein